MKKAFVLFLIICLILSVCACSASETPEKESPVIESPVIEVPVESPIEETPIDEALNSENEERLTGEWIWQSYPDNPCYMFLRFKGKTVQYGMSLFGENLENGTWDCKYSVNDTKLKLTTSDGSVFEFEVKRSNDSIRIFDDEGNEYVCVN